MGQYQSKVETPPASVTSPGMIKAAAVVYIDEDSPPYETPLDMRYPLHWNSKANFAKGGMSGIEPPELEPARDELRPLGVLLDYGDAWGMSHYTRDRASPCFFRVDFEEADESTWTEIHETVVQTIKKHFGHMEEYRKPVIRYVRSNKEPMIGEGGSGLFV